jgi:Carboxypeptidase regulatory-like domain
MKSIKLLPLLLAGILATSFAFAKNEEEGKLTNAGTLHGYVVDAVTKKPLAGVTISAKYAKHAAGKAVKTDASGYFKINELEAGNVKVSVDKKGYHSYQKEMVEVKEGTLTKMNFEITANKPETGEVEDYDHPFMRIDVGL